LILRLADLADMRVTVMGLGLHGGGVASARFFASRGARVTVTDMKSREELHDSLEALADLPIRYVLGEHREEDFTDADLVIKNPAVPSASRFLSLAPQLETDISVFLRFNRRPVLAVTGSKGKSTTVSALHAALLAEYPRSRLGGNITVSPLTFIDECLQPSEDPVVLELSSWQLGDLPQLSLLAPRIAVVTNIFSDHQNRYNSMDEYVCDKERIFLAQRPEQYTLLNLDDPYCERFAAKTPAQPLYFSSRPLPPELTGGFLQEGVGYFRGHGGEEEILPARVNLPGAHNRINLLTAGLCARLFGLSAETIRKELARFTGIEHRLELAAVIRDCSWYNDSAATIPDATEAALASFTVPVHLIAGGTDKEIDFSAFERLAPSAASIHLLAGSATRSMAAILQQMGLAYEGPFDNLESVVASARKAAGPGEVVLFSPGATSFGMFANEFDRGRRFKEAVRRVAEHRSSEP
jgi:UDP-N-acetylmuramoylalanine--D-glutamate ligase